MSNSDFISFIKHYDLICLVETWAKNENDFENILPGYCCYQSIRKKLKRFGRYSGGVAVYLKDCIKDKFKRIHVDWSDCICLTSDLPCLDDKYVILLFVYISPESAEHSDGIDTLSSRVSSLKEVYPEYWVVLCGDMNSRTGRELDYIEDDNITHLPIDDSVYDARQCNLVNRSNKDNVVNNYGKQLLDLCKLFNLNILNGRWSESSSDFTYIGSNGCSVVDYCCVSSDIYSFILDFSIITRVESDHLPLSIDMSFCFNNVTRPTNFEDSTSAKRIRYKWKDCYSDTFIQLFQSEFYRLEKFVLDINVAITRLLDLLKYCGTSMLSRNGRKANPQPVWFDAECESAKNDKYACLKYFRNYPSSLNLTIFKQARNKFKNLCAKKKKVYNETVGDSLTKALHDHDYKEFWKLVKKYTFSRTNSNKITAFDWQHYFEGLLNPKANLKCNDDFDKLIYDAVVSHDSNDCTLCLHEDDLSNDITQQEVNAAIDKLKCDKAPGSDGVPSEFFKCIKFDISPYLAQLFTQILNSGRFPNAWTEAIIVPLHKKGSVNVCSNYRGISLLNTMCKIFTFILNNRINIYVENNDIIGEYQGGFRKAHSTVDNVFILQSLVQKYITRRKHRFYCCFVDFKKAFDMVDRKKLLYLLLSNGIHGRLYKILSNMYEIVKSAVVLDGGCKLSEYFNSAIGVRQGCSLSPLLFSIFIKELVESMNAEIDNGIFVSEDMYNILALLFADDLILVADTPIKLQKQLNFLYDYCIK